MVNNDWATWSVEWDLTGPDFKTHTITLKMNGQPFNILTGSQFVPKDSEMVHDGWYELTKNDMRIVIDMIALGWEVSRLPSLGNRSPWA